MLKSVLCSCVTDVACWHDLCFVSSSMLFCQAHQSVKQPRLSFPKTIAASGIPAADSKPTKPTSTHRKRAHSCTASLSARCRQPPSMLFYIPSSPPEYYNETRADNAEKMFVLSVPIQWTTKGRMSSFILAWLCELVCTSFST